MFLNLNNGLLKGKLTESKTRKAKYMISVKKRKYLSLKYLTSLMKTSVWFSFRRFLKINSFSFSKMVLRKGNIGNCKSFMSPSELVHNKFC